MAKQVSESGFDLTPLSDEEVRERSSKLTAEQYNVTQRAGTESAFCGGLLDNKRTGVYACIVCELPLFSSEHKFDSGSGWPSFFAPFDADHVDERADRGHGMERIEIACRRCSAHLGHVFPDGPRPTSRRFCLNSASMKFSETDADTKTEVAYFAGGCFWGIEHYFQKGPGVISAESGYMQGHVDNPTYDQVCREDTGHAEVVKVVFDPEQISYERLVEAFFVMHDPTQLDRQGPDIGRQYRSGLYTTSDEQAEQAKSEIAKLERNGAFDGRPIVTEVEPARAFWKAEEYHQDYLEKHPGRYCHTGDPW